MHFEVLYVLSLSIEATHIDALSIQVHQNMAPFMQGTICALT
jgi:hypothetical protein